MIPFYRHWLFRWTITLVSLLGLLLVVSAADVLAALRTVPVGRLLPACLLSLLLQCVMSARLKLLFDLQELRLTLGQVLQLDLISRFYSLWWPGGNTAGLMVRILQAAGRSERIIAATAAVFVDRLFATTSVLLFGALCWLVERSQAGPDLLLDIAPAARAMLVAGGAVLVLAILGMRFFGSRPASALTRWWQRGGDAMARFRAMSAALFTITTGLSLLAQLLGTLVHFSIATSLGLDVGFWALGWIRAVLLLATALPLTVAGLGLREATAVLLLPLYGVSPEAALVFALAVFVVTRLLIGLLGGVVQIYGSLADRLAIADRSVNGKRNNGGPPARN